MSVIKNPLVKVLIIFIACILTARLFWSLGFIPNAMKNIVDPGNCTSHQVKTLGMYLCSAFVALKTLIGPILFVVLIFVFRKTIYSLIKKFQTKIPRDFRFLLNPLVATLIFTIVWSGSHYSTSRTIGIFQQRSFPVVIGLFTFLTSTYHKEIQTFLSGFFKKRDVIPKLLRYGAAIGIPMLLSLIITFQDRVSSVALKEQFIVIVSLLCGYLVLIPKRGTINLTKK